jgi:hypothetical protein
MLLERNMRNLRMFRTLLGACALLAFTSVTGFGFTQQTRRDELCGVELYEERSDRPDVCGNRHAVKASPACPFDRFESGTDLACPGADAGGRKVKPQARFFGNTAVTIDWGRAQGGSIVQGDENLSQLVGSSYADYKTFGTPASGGGGYRWVKESRYWSCVLEAQKNPQFSYVSVECTAKPYATTCEAERFGKIYKSCESTTHEIVGAKTCRSDQFRPELYKSCSFYKTRDELNVYLTEVSSSADNYIMILPTRQADLYSKLRDEASFKCLIEKYDGTPFMDEVVVDLKEKFFLIFGLQYDESEVDCKNVSINVNPEVTAGKLNCKNYTYDSLKALILPEGMSKGLFDSFVKKCQSKIVYDNLSSWFETKKDEISLLEDDLAAQKDTGLRNRLLELKTRLDDATK